MADYDTNYILSQGVTTKIADALDAVEVSPFIFVIPDGAKNTRQIKLTADITGPAACKGHLQYRPTDDMDFVDDGPDNSLDFVAFKSQVVQVMPGQYKLELDTMTSTAVDVYATLD